MNRVIVVLDDDEVAAAGREVLLRRLGREVVVADWPRATATLSAVGRRAGLVVAGVRADPTGWDRYAAVAAAGRLDRTLEPGTRVVALVDDRSESNPLLGVRLAGQGVSELLRFDAVRTGGSLAELISGGLRGPHPQATERELAWAGVGRRTDPEAVLARVLELAAGDSSYLRAFQPGFLQNRCGLSRRGAHHLRVDVAELGDLLPSAGQAMGGPARDRSLARWTDMVDVVNRCRGWDPADELHELFPGRAAPVRPEGAASPARAEAGRRR